MATQKSHDMEIWKLANDEMQNWPEFDLVSRAKMGKLKWVYSEEISETLFDRFPK